MTIDIELIRNVVTVASFAAFLGIVLWSYAPARKERLQAQARSILEDAE